jgi:hypothetical protein
MNFDHTVVPGKRFAPDLQQVAAEDESTGNQFSGVVGGKRSVELDAVARKFHRGFERETAGPDDFEMKVSGIALRRKRESEEKDTEVERFAHDLMGNIYAISFGDTELSY